jgi:hypothetical protein
MVMPLNSLAANLLDWQDENANNAIVDMNIVMWNFITVPPSIYLCEYITKRTVPSWSNK